MKTVSLQTITITAETLQVLAKQKEYGNLLALYIMYVEITTWQNNNSVKATTEFMSNRLHWDRHKVIRLKKALIELDLVRDVIKKDDKGKVLGHYILVRHVYSDESNHPAISPQGGSHHRVVSKQTSANDLKESANDLKKKPDPETETKIDKLYRLYLIRMKLDFRRIEQLPIEDRRALLEAAKQKCRLTPLRRDKLIARLKDAGYEMCYKAIRNISESDFHRGENERKWYAKLEWIMGSYEKVEEWANKENPNE